MTSAFRLSRSFFLLACVPAFAFFSFARPAHAFLDEIVTLKQELALWEQENAADFSEVLAQLEDIVTPVFRDVASADWFSAYVASLAEWDIVSGYKDTTGRQTGEFKPTNSVTIAEILKMALKAANIDERACTQAPQNAQASNHWARAYVACAEAMHIRLFVPALAVPLDRPAARAEVVSIVNDAFQEKVLPLYSNFVDTVGHAFEADIAYAAFNGVVGGDKDPLGNPTGTFRPNDRINRAETAKIIYEQLKAVTARDMGF